MQFHLAEHHLDRQIGLYDLAPQYKDLYKGKGGQFKPPCA